MAAEQKVTAHAKRNSDAVCCIVTPPPAGTQTITDEALKFYSSLEKALHKIKPRQVLLICAGRHTTDRTLEVSADSVQIFGLPLNPPTDPPRGKAGQGARYATAIVYDSNINLVQTLLRVNGHNVTIRNITFRGSRSITQLLQEKSDRKYLHAKFPTHWYQNYADQRRAALIEVNGQATVMEDTEVIGSTGCGMGLNGRGNVHLSRSFVWGHHCTGIAVRDERLLDLRASTVETCEHNGIHFSEAAKGKLLSCTITRNGWCGVQAETSGLIQIEDSHVTWNYRSGVAIMPVRHPHQLKVLNKFAAEADAELLRRVGSEKASFVTKSGFVPDRVGGSNGSLVLGSASIRHNAFLNNMLAGVAFSNGCTGLVERNQFSHNGHDPKMNLGWAAIEIFFCPFDSINQGVNLSPEAKHPMVETHGNEYEESKYGDIGWSDYLDNVAGWALKMKGGEAEEEGTSIVASRFYCGSLQPALEGRGEEEGLAETIQHAMDRGVNSERLEKARSLLFPDGFPESLAYEAKQVSYNHCERMLSGSTPSDSKSHARASHGGGGRKRGKGRASAAAAAAAASDSGAGGSAGGGSDGSDTVTPSQSQARSAMDWKLHTKIVDLMSAQSLSSKDVLEQSKLADAVNVAKAQVTNWFNLWIATVHSATGQQPAGKKLPPAHHSIMLQPKLAAWANTYRETPGRVTSISAEPTAVVKPEAGVSIASGGAGPTAPPPTLDASIGMLVPTALPVPTTGSGAIVVDDDDSESAVASVLADPKIGGGAASAATTSLSSPAPSPFRTAAAATGIAPLVTPSPPQAKAADALTQQPPIAVASQLPPPSQPPPLSQLTPPAQAPQLDVEMTPALPPTK